MREQGIKREWACNKCGDMIKGYRLSGLCKKCSRRKMKEKARKTLKSQEKSP